MIMHTHGRTHTGSEGRGQHGGDIQPRPASHCLLDVGLQVLEHGGGEDEAARPEVDGVREGLAEEVQGPVDLFGCGFGGWAW
jgi:hypothetical protein